MKAHFEKEPHFGNEICLQLCYVCRKVSKQKMCPYLHAHTRIHIHNIEQVAISCDAYVCATSLNVRCKWGRRSKKISQNSEFAIDSTYQLYYPCSLGGNEAVNNTMHQQLPASSYAGLPHAPTIQQVNNLGPVNPEPQSPINPALMAQPNQQQMQVIHSSNAVEVVQY